MNKKYSRVLVAVVLLVVIVAVGIVMSRSKKDTTVNHTSPSNEASPMTVAEAKAKMPADPPKCLAENKDIPQEGTPDQDNLGQEVVGHLIDVPAGTNVPIHITTFSDTDATGMADYPKDYGKYNFTAQRDSSHSTGWRITSFVGCKD